MTTIKDIADLLSQISKIVKDTRSILKAITDGKEFLARKFPNASKDFSKLLLQMETTMEGLAEVTGVARSFRFTLGSEHARERDLSRFNKHIIDHNKQVAKLKKNCPLKSTDTVNLSEILLSNKFRFSENFKFLEYHLRIRCLALLHIFSMYLRSIDSRFPCNIACFKTDYITKLRIS